VKGALVTVGLLIGLPTTGHGDWPQWRGPARDGSVAARSRGEAWPARAVLLGEREVGEGY
jgi:hypothetical protein